MRIARLLAPALAALALVIAPADAGASPLDGNGSWIWYLSASGGEPADVARAAKRHGLDTVFVKGSDGAGTWSQFTPALVRALHKRGVKVCSWSYVYGSDPKGEARATANAAKLGADCLIIDAETEYQGKYRQAYIYTRELRRLVGDDYPLALASFPYTYYHQTFPYSVFLGKDGAQFNAPQLYWHAIGDSVETAMENTFPWNRVYDRPIFPAGQTYDNPPRRELTSFRRYAKEFGAAGVSWWSWQETSGKEWKRIGRKRVRAVKGYDARRDYPEIGPGDEGDTVLVAQELLIAWDKAVLPTARFDKRTTRAVRSFQEEQGLAVGNAIGDEVWKRLLKRDAESTNWAKTKVPDPLERRSALRVAAEFVTPPR